MKKLMSIIIVGFLFCEVWGGEKIFQGTSFSESREQSVHKSLSKAILLSALFPGTGESYLGVNGWNRYLTVGDGAILACALSFAIAGIWRTQEYQTFAQKYAGVNPTGKDYDFFKNVGLYSSRDIYNYIQKLYYRKDAHTYPETPDWYWNWRTEQDQLKYYDILTSSEKMWRNFKIALGIAGLNRVISMINVFRIYRGGAPLNLEAEINPSQTGSAGVRLKYTFQF